MSSRGTADRPSEQAEGWAAVQVVMGSSSDLETMSGAVTALEGLGVTAQVRVVSAHRSPLEMVDFGRQARDRGVQVIIAGAGGAAHLPGMLASLTTLPVIGVPVPLRHLDGLDSLLSIVQMPGGVPVATVGIGAARNAGLLAARILALHDPVLAGRLDQHALDLAKTALEQDASIRPDAQPGRSPG